LCRKCGREFNKAKNESKLIMFIAEKNKLITKKILQRNIFVASFSILLLLFLIAENITGTGIMLAIIIASIIVSQSDIATVKRQEYTDINNDVNMEKNGQVRQGSNDAPPSCFLPNA
jgi:hypothetical protein